MSGYGDYKRISKLLREYGYYKAFPMELFAEPDKALYETIWELNMKYGTPYVTFDKRYNFMGYGKETPAMYTPDHKEHINNFDSILIKMEKIPAPVRKAPLPRPADSSSWVALLLFLISQSQNESKQPEREKE